MSADWLDSVLVNRPAVDEGFADRVIAVDRAHRRMRGILSALAVVLALSFVTASILAVAGHSIERWNTNSLFDDGDLDRVWLLDSRDDFRAEFKRLDASPALARRTGKDAGPVLDPIIAALNDPSPAIKDSCAVEYADAKHDAYAQGMHVTDRSGSRCDTSFLVGLAAFDEWRHPVVIGGESAPMFVLEIARTHLRRAADQDGAAFAAAAKDVEAYARLALGHDWSGRRAFGIVTAEQALAAARGRDGGFTPSLTADDVKSVGRIYGSVVGFGGALGTDDDVAFIAAGRSVLSCPLRADTDFDLVMQEAFVDRDVASRNAVFTPDGCAPRNPDVGPWLLCGDEPTLKCRASGAFLSLPLVRMLMAGTVSSIRYRPDLSPDERPATVLK